MRYFCDICHESVKQKNKNSRPESKSHKDFENFKHIILLIKIVDMKDVDEILYLYLKHHNKMYNHYLIEGEFKLVFNNNQDCKSVMTGMTVNKTFIKFII